MDLTLIPLRATAPIKFHADLPDATMAAITGVRSYTRNAVPFFDDTQFVTETPALKLRPSEAPGAPGTWLIVDNLSAPQRIALGEMKARVRLTTGCREDDRDGAAEAFIAYADDKRLRIAARIMPERLPIAAILYAYFDHLEFGAHNLRAGSVTTYTNKLVPIAEFFGEQPLGALTKKMEKRYERWRRRQTTQAGTPISTTEVGHEIATLRQAINHFQEGTPLNINLRHYLPARDTPPVVWHNRDEIARHLWACRGRIAAVERDADGKENSWRWRVARDDDRSLAGPEGDRRVLRSRADIERRKAEARRVICGLYTPSRAMVLLDTTYADENKHAYVSFVENQIRRKPIGAADSHKRRPPVPIGRKIGRFLVNWAINDAPPNGWRRQRAMRLIHQPNGEPCSEAMMRDIRAEVQKDSGVTKPIPSLILRHSAAMWMKIEGISAWLAANFLGCSVKVLEERYGTWDALSLFEAADALCRGAKQKEAIRKAKAQGIAHLT